MSEKKEISQETVKQANRILYDAVAANYEAVDGRRSCAVEQWVREKLSTLRKQVQGDVLLDLGTGGGFIPRCAEGIFKTRIGTDISPLILAANRSSFDLSVAADVDNLPFRDMSVDIVSSFAVLHHILHFDGLVKEVARILKPGGIFYSDHDMNSLFYNRFKIPLRIFRVMRNAKNKYMNASPDITDEIYENSEIHEDGIDSISLVKIFEKANFSVRTNYHWYGLLPLTDKIFGQRFFPAGFAPIVSITATKL